MAGNSISVCRGTWFTGTSSTDAWQPLSEEDANQIEESHQTMWRAMVGPTLLFSPLLNSQAFMS